MKSSGLVTRKLPQAWFPRKNLLANHFGVRPGDFHSHPWSVSVSRLSLGVKTSLSTRLERPSLCSDALHPYHSLDEEIENESWPGLVKRARRFIANIAWREILNWLPVLFADRNKSDLMANWFESWQSQIDEEQKANKKCIFVTTHKLVMQFCFICYNFTSSFFFFFLRSPSRKVLRSMEMSKFEPS